QRFLQQSESSHNVGLYELCRAIDRAVNVGLGREVHHGIGLIPVEQRTHCGTVRDIDLREPVTRVTDHLRQRTQVRRVGELIDIEHEVISISKKMPYERGTDETGPPGNKDSASPKAHLCFHLESDLCTASRYSP